jgi:hypothetical protein
MAASTTYLSLGSFYAADKRRNISREHDVGLWWLGVDWHAPRFRAAWVAETGELYLMQHEGTPGGGRVDVVATGTLEDIERRLEGWRDVVGEWDSVRWLLERLSPGVPGHVLSAAGMTTAERVALAEPAALDAADTPAEPRFARRAAADVA